MSDVKISRGYDVSLVFLVWQYLQAYAPHRSTFSVNPSSTVDLSIAGRGFRLDACNSRPLRPVPPQTDQIEHRMMIRHRCLNCADSGRGFWPTRGRHCQHQVRKFQAPTHEPERIGLNARVLQILGRLGARSGLRTDLRAGNGWTASGLRTQTDLHRSAKTQLEMTNPAS